MKKILLCLFLFSFAYSHSQERRSSFGNGDTGQNELSIGALNLVAFGALDVAYERILNKNSSFAGELFIKALNRDSEEISDAYRRKFGLTGKFKYFFGDDYAEGFYVNGFTMISSGEYEPELDYIPNPDSPPVDHTEDYTDLALGFGVGGKFVASGGFFLDLGAGIGRNLFNSNAPTIVGQINVNLGFRF